MRLAALSDIHANLPALEAVLEEVEQADVDALVVCGDTVWGPMPVETLARLRRVAVPIHFVRGNADRLILEQLAGRDVTEELSDGDCRVAAWVASQLEPEHREWLSAWQATQTLRAEGLGDVLFCHATPQDDTTIYTRRTPEDRLLPLFEGVGADLVVCGHTHMQSDRMVGKVRVVNTGSVGRPYGEPGACWLTMESDIEFRRTLYDFEEAARRVRATDYPEAEKWSAQVLRPLSAAEMLDKFEAVALGRYRG